MNFCSILLRLTLLPISAEQIGAASHWACCPDSRLSDAIFIDTSGQSLAGNFEDVVAGNGDTICHLPGIGSDEKRQGSAPVARAGGELLFEIKRIQGLETFKRDG